MDGDTLFSKAINFLHQCPINYFDEKYIENHKELIGVKLFDDPIFSIGSSNDPLFQDWKKDDVLHPDTWLPEDWLLGAKSVITYFVPFQKSIVEANAKDLVQCVDEWYFARLRGQDMVDTLSNYVRDLLIGEGERAVVPATTGDYRAVHKGVFTWSERHAGYICGLGTFGISGSLITSKGTAGRIGSIITSGEFSITKRAYTDWLQYCNSCGACAINCPAQAIDAGREKGKTRDGDVCWSHLLAHMTHNGKGPFGCGKCSVNVPCQSGIP